MTCLPPGAEFKLSFPPRSFVRLDVEGLDGRPTFVVTRAAEVLHTGRPGPLQTLSGWLFSGSQPAALSMRVAADAGHSGQARISYLYTSFAFTGARVASASDGGGVEYVTAAATPALAPLLPTTTFEFAAEDSVFRRADAPGCTPPVINTFSYVSFVVDAGQWSAREIGFPPYPDYDAVVLGSDGGLLASGVLGTRLDFSLDAGQTVTFGWAPLDGGPTATCSFDGGVDPVIANNPRAVRVD